MTPEKDRLLIQTMDWVRSQIAAPDQRQISDQDRADAALAARAFRGTDGAALLELFGRLTVLRPPLNPHLSGSASHDYAQRRTGENGVFAALVHLLDLHDHLQRKDHDRPHSSDPVFGWTDAPGLATRDPEPDAGDEPAFGRVRFDEAGAVAAG